MRVVLGMPRYDSRAHFAAAQAFYYPSSPDSPHEVRHVSHGTSLLTPCFNALWAVARDEWEAGNADGFAMIHSDVGPQIYWLDILHDELEASGADMIGVTMPIKDSRGLHSTAVETGDKFRVRRLSSWEIMELPETFTDKDVPGLLLNTGLWLCKLGPWCLDVMFHIEDTIIRNASGKWAAGSVPEDWGFSRQCRAKGLKIACTRKVKAEHYGEKKWSNQEQWGWHTDLQNDPSLAGWLMPRDVDGWLTDEEGRELAFLAAGRDVLEIGSFCGLSTICMAQTAASVVCVDTFDGRSTPNPMPTLDKFNENITRYGCRGKVKAIPGTSTRIVPPLGRRFDLGFIDGAHDRKSVLADAAVVRDALRPGGLAAFHDYRRLTDPEVTLAVNEILAGGGELVHTVGTVAVLKLAGWGM